MSLKELLLNTVLFCTTTIVGAEELRGIVIDKNGSKPIKEVTVSIGHTLLRTTTDSDGAFSIDLANASISNVPKVIKKTHIFWNNRNGVLDLGGISSLSEIHLYNLRGSVVFQTDRIPENRQIQLPSISTGIYLLRLSAENGVIYTCKINTSGSASVFTLHESISKSRVAALSQPVKLLFRHDDYYPVDLVAYPGQQLKVSLEKDPSSFVFDRQKIHSYYFTMSQSDSLHMERYAIDENYVPAFLTFDGDAFAKVGIRYKGSNYSLPNCFDSVGNRYNKPECKKISFKVKFDKYIDSLRLYKMKAINLHSMSTDGSKMHEMLAYKMYRDMGIYAPRTSYAKVFVNGVYQGAFVAIEAFDGRFTKSRWPEFGDGNLYKEAWPVYPIRSYYTDALKTNDKPEDSADVSTMFNLSRAIKNSTKESFLSDVSPYLDIDYMVRYFAVDRAIKNWDGVTGWYSSGTWKGNHNFYIYQEESAGGKSWLIPWDLDNTFWRTDPFIESANVPNWNEKTQDCTPIEVWGGKSHVIPSNCDKLTSMIAELRWNEFVKAGEELLKNYFNIETIQKDISAYRTLIDTIVKNDPRVVYGSWDREVSYLNRTISLLHTDFHNYIHNIKVALDTSDYSVPFTGNGALVFDRTNNFEFTPVVGTSFPSSITYSSDSATVSLVHSTENPIWGSADLLYKFMYRRVDDAKAYSERSGFVLWTNETNISSYKEIRVSLRADKSRNVWVSIKSPVYDKYGIKESYGWFITVNTTPKIYRFGIDDINYPTWANPDNPLLIDTVLATSTGIAFDPNPVFDSQGELLVAPDEGFLRVDNIKFVF